jgi:hypothetical protein
VLVAEFPEPVDLSSFSAVEFDAAMSASNVVGVELDGVDGGCQWESYPADSGAITYTLDLALPDNCDNPSVSFTQVTELKLLTDWGQASDFEIEVFDVRFVE